MHSRTYYDMPGNADGNKAFLDFFHYLGDEKSYNQLLISPPNLWEKELREFYTKVYQGIQVIGSQKIDNYVANVAKSLVRGGNGNSWSGHGPNWYTNDTEEDAISNIGQWVNSNITGSIRRDRFLRDEIQKIAEYIYSEIGKKNRELIASQNESLVASITPRSKNNSDIAQSISNMEEGAPQVVTFPLQGGEGGSAGGGGGGSAAPDASANRLPKIGFDNSNIHTMYATSTYGANA